MKFKACDFCGNSFDMANFEDHTNKCDFKTYKCNTCQNYVKFMDR